MSRETTFAHDLHAVQHKAELGAVFTRLCERVAEDLQRKGYAGRTIGIKLRYANFKSVTREITVEQFTQEAATIRQIAGQCLRRVPLEQPLRLLGVRVGGLVVWDAAQQQPRGAEKVTIKRHMQSRDLLTLPLF